MKKEFIKENDIEVTIVMKDSAEVFCFQFPMSDEMTNLYNKLYKVLSKDGKSLINFEKMRNKAWQFALTALFEPTLAEKIRTQLKEEITELENVAAKQN